MKRLFILFCLSSFGLFAQIKTKKVEILSNSKEFTEIIEKKNVKLIDKVQEWYYSKSKSAVESNGGVSTDIKTSSPQMTIEELKKDGWIEKTSEIDDNKVEDSIIINGVEWVKVETK